MNRQPGTPGGKRKIGILFTGGPHTVQQTIEYVRMAERCGYDSAWAADDIGGRDPFVHLASWATATHNIRLGVAVANPYTRHPISIAQILATLDEASNGRAVLGLGNGDSWKEFISNRWDKPIRTMKETVQFLRNVWREPDTTYQGIRVSLRESLWVWPDTEQANFRKSIPIYIGATGPQMTATAGRIADGLIIEMSRLLSDMEHQVRIFQEAALKEGRQPENLDIAPLIKISVVENEAEQAVIRRIVAFEIARLSEEVALQQGFEIGPFRKIKSIYASFLNDQGGPLEHGNESAGHIAAAWVTQRMLDALAVVGDADRCLSLLERYPRLGLNLPLLIPLGCDPYKVIEVGQAYITSA
jgi:5,10-methylenetetrahydromethanopterin reductase